MHIPEKAKCFITAYVGEAKFNATLAAKIAGYKSPGVQGSQLKKKYSQAIEQLVLESQSTETLSRTESLKILAEIARDSSHKDRLRAVELSLKVHGMLSDKLNLNIKREDLNAQLIEIVQSLAVPELPEQTN